MPELTSTKNYYTYIAFYEAEVGYLKVFIYDVLRAFEAKDHYVGINRPPFCRRVPTEEMAPDNLLSLSDEENSSKNPRFPLEKLPELYPGCCGNVTAPEFNPHWYCWFKY